MAIASELINVLGFRIEGEENLKKFKKEFDKAEKEAIAHEKASVARGKRIGVGVAAGITALAVGGKKAYDAWLPVELRLARVALNAGKSTKEVPGMFGKISELAQRYGTTTDIVATGLENLVAKGADVEDAFDQLPDILTTVQGFGVEIDDAADTAYKLADAFKLTKDEAKQLSDVLGASGQSGQFEYNDFARYAPGLGNLYAATTGRTGIAGVKELSALGQTIREDVATSGEAATLMENLLSKVYSEQTIKNFKKRGVDLRAEMKTQMDEGKEFVIAFADILDRAIGGDMSRLGEIFPDLQAASAARSVLTSRDRYEYFRKAVDDPTVAGTAMRNVNEVLDLQITKVERLTERWNSFWTTLGAKVSGPVGTGLDFLNTIMSDDDAINAALEKRGYSGPSLFLKKRTMWSAEKPELIREGRDILAGKTPPKVASGGDSIDPSNHPYTPSLLGGSSPLGKKSPVGFANVATKGDIASILSSMDHWNAQVLGDGAANAVITDSRTDARDMSVKVGPTTINQTITTPTAAPATAAGAVSERVAGAITGQAARIQQEPSF